MYLLTISENELFAKSVKIPLGSRNGPHGLYKRRTTCGSVCTRA